MKYSLIPIKIGVAISLIQLLLVNSASAASINVTNGFDLDVGCTLREALTSINDASATGGCIATGTFGSNDTINFNVESVSVVGSQLVVGADVSINPGGDAVTISGNGDDRVIAVGFGANATMNNLTITGGVRPDVGGGISVINSILTLNNCTISGNTSGGNGGGIFGSGFTTARITLNNSTVSGNTSGENGGGVYFFGLSFSLNNSTVSGNVANNGGGLSLQDSLVRLENSTISMNSSSGNGGGIYINNAINNVFRVIFILNSIIAGNQASNDNEFTFISQSFGNIVTTTNNLIGDASQTFDQAFSQDTSTEQPAVIFNDTNIIATSDGDSPTPLSQILAPLADNGGPTLTHALLLGSPAVDGVDDPLCAVDPIDAVAPNDLDQRGEPRPQGDTCDIGAFEVQDEQDETPFFVVPLPTGNSVIFNL